jgi:hypothetical protein
MRQYTIENLKLLEYEPLYRHFQWVRAYFSSLNNFEPERPLHEDDRLEIERTGTYLDQVKAELQSRPYQEINKKSKKQARKRKLADLKGNRKTRNRSHRKAVPILH